MAFLNSCYDEVLAFSESRAPQNASSHLILRIDQRREGGENRS